MESSNNGYQDGILSIITFLKLGIISLILFLGCFAACLGSVSLTLLRLRCDRTLQNITHKRYVGESHRTSHRHHHTSRSNAGGNGAGGGVRAKAAIEAAEQACNVAFKRMEDKFMVPSVKAYDPSAPSAMGYGAPILEVVVDKK